MVLISPYALPILFLIVPAALAAAVSEGPTKCSESSTCNTDVCKHISKRLLDNLDQTVNPCDNFYDFACGGYVKSKKIPSDENVISVMSELGAVVTDQLHSVIKEPIDSKDPEAFKLAKKLFSVCMDKEAIEKNNLATAKNLFKKLGEWPVLEGNTWKEDEFDWKNQMYKLRQNSFNADSLFKVFISPSTQNSSQNILNIDEPELSLNRMNLVEGFSNNVVQQYYEYLVDLAVMLGADKDVASSQLKESLDFMIELGKITASPEERRNITFMTNVMTVGELQKKFPYVDWVNYFNNVVAIPGTDINENDTVDIGPLKLLGGLETLLNKFSTRVQANHIMSLVAASLVPTLTENIQDRLSQLMKKISGTEEVKPKWSNCLATVLRLKVAVGALYARKFFNEGSKSSVESLVSSLHSKLLNMLKEVDWMDEETRKNALDKASAFKSFVAYPSELMDNKSIDDYYANLKSSDDYLQFILNIQKFENDLKLKKLREEVRKGYWADTSGTQEINAFYNVQENSIILPAGILQGMFYHVEKPKAMNFGAIGYFVGHELTHGFDDNGKQVNKDGEVKNWWSDVTSAEYVKKAQCIIDQYNNFRSERLNVSLNGVVTQGENIADNGGAKIAYEAYQTWLRQNGADKCLPNVNYNQNQLFWIAFANTWCSSSTPDAFKNEMLLSDHSPGYYRVLGTVSNSKQFADDFQCPSGSPMNPVSKCSFW